MIIFIIIYGSPPIYQAKINLQKWQIALALMPSMFLVASVQAYQTFVCLLRKNTDSALDEVCT